MNPFLASDGYKTDHHRQYPKGTTLVYSNFTPRAAKHAPKGVNKDYIISFGQQMVMRQIKEMFDNNFFKKEDILNRQRIQGDSTILAKNLIKKQVCHEIKKEYSLYLGSDYDISHIEQLWDLGYLPIKVKSLPEGTRVPIGVPVLTVYNTKPEFYWLTNFLETLISNLLWKPMTSATIAYNYRQNLNKWALDTDKENIGFVDFQGHDFSMRGMDSVDATISSGLGHATSFLGSDSLPVIHGARKYYDEKDMVVMGVPATEHSVMCAGSKDDEIGTFKRLIELYPTGILSVVSDTWDLWKVITEYLPALKEEILARDGKLVIRPDSGDPVDIICGSLKIGLMLDMSKFKEGTNNSGECYSRLNFRNSSDTVPPFIRDINTLEVYKTHYRNDKADGYYSVEKVTDIDNINKGVIELLWDIFGGTINEQGYKVLDSHIGAIYGDSITLERADEICKRLEAKGFASTNIVLGIGSFTYQYNTRDTFGFAMKATYVEIANNIWDEGVKGKTYSGIKGREIFKDPITDDGTKKSAKGLLRVFENITHNMEHISYELKDQQTWEEENKGSLQTIFEDGKFYNETTLTEIRSKLQS